MHHFIEKEKLVKYLYGMLTTDINEAYLEKKRNKFINDINNFNNKHITQYYNKTQSNIPEEPCYISSMALTGFING